MKKINIKGSALVQVLVLSALISTIVVVLLKFAMTRSSNMVQMKNTVGARLAVQGCMAQLNEVEIARANNGQVPYFEENTTFTCSFDNYMIEATRGNYANNNRRDFSPGVVRPVNFKITLYNPEANSDSNSTN